MRALCVQTGAGYRAPAPCTRRSSTPSCSLFSEPGRPDATRSRALTCVQPHPKRDAGDLDDILVPFDDTEDAPARASVAHALSGLAGQASGPSPSASRRPARLWWRPPSVPVLRPRTLIALVAAVVVVASSATRDRGPAPIPSPPAAAPPAPRHDLPRRDVRPRRRPSARRRARAERTRRRRAPRRVVRPRVVSEDRPPATHAQPRPESPPPAPTGSHFTGEFTP